MAMSRRTFINTCFGLGVIAVAGRQVARAEVHREQWYLFGTLVDITLNGVGQGEAASALRVLSDELRACNRDWHPWQPGMMGDINCAMAAGEAVTVDAHMAHMIRQIQALYTDSEGLFNPAIGKVVAQWGFHGGKSQDWQLPPKQEIDRLVATAPTPLDLRLDGDLLRSDNRAVQLDLGGYAKGYAIDLGRRLLARHGVDHALINAGGDLVTLGNAPNGGPWRVAIRHPQRPRQVAWLETYAGEAVFTSGNYARYREHDGHRYPHIIDPRSGMPVQGIASATVVHGDAAFADAAATALVVAGTRRWREVVAGLGIDQALLVDEQGRVAMTLAMRERAHLSG